MVLIGDCLGAPGVDATVWMFCLTASVGRGCDPALYVPWLPLGGVLTKETLSMPRHARMFLRQETNIQKFGASTNDNCQKQTQNRKLLANKNELKS